MIKVGAIHRQCEGCAVHDPSRGRKRGDRRHRVVHGKRRISRRAAARSRVGYRHVERSRRRDVRRCDRRRNLSGAHKGRRLGRSVEIHHRTGNKVRPIHRQRERRSACGGAGGRNRGDGRRRESNRCRIGCRLPCRAGIAGGRNANGIDGRAGGCRRPRSRPN